MSLNCLHKQNINCLWCRLLEHLSIEYERVYRACAVLGLVTILQRCTTPPPLIFLKMWAACECFKYETVSMMYFENYLKICNFKVLSLIVFRFWIFQGFPFLGHAVFGRRSSVPWVQFFPCYVGRSDYVRSRQGMKCKVIEFSQR